MPPEPAQLLLFISSQPRPRLERKGPWSLLYRCLPPPPPQGLWVPGAGVGPEAHVLPGGRRGPKARRDQGTCSESVCQAHRLPRGWNWAGPAVGAELAAKNPQHLQVGERRVPRGEFGFFPADDASVETKRRRLGGNSPSPSLITTNSITTANSSLPSISRALPRPRDCVPHGQVYQGRRC